MSLKNDIEHLLPHILDEVQWGKSYRQQKKQERKKSIGPLPSPINVQQLWDQYQMSKQVEEIKELKRKLLSKHLPRKNSQKGRVDPDTSNKKKYYNYLSAPKHRVEATPPPYKLKVRRPKEECSPRLLHLAAPRKLRVLCTWKDFQYSLPIDFIGRLEELLQTDHNLDPKFARCYFKTLDRKRRKDHLKRLKMCKREKRKQKRDGNKWLNLQINTTAGLIVNFLKREPLFALNFKQMLISNAILKELHGRGDIKHIPARNTGKPYGRAVVDIVDQLSVWMDMIVRYVDVQYTESQEEIFEIPSMEGLLGVDEEAEGEEGEEEGGGEEGMSGIKHVLLPPLSEQEDMLPLQFSPDILNNITEEENTTTYGTESSAGPSPGGNADQSGFDELTSGEEDALDILIAILSNSAPEMLDQMVNPDVLPDITYSEVLNRLQELRDKTLAEEKRQRQAVLEDAMVTWAETNEPDRVDDKVRDKIQYTAAIISECIKKEAAQAAAYKKIVEDSMEAAGEGESPMTTDTTLEGAIRRTADGAIIEDTTTDVPTTDGLVPEELTSGMQGEGESATAEGMQGESVQGETEPDGETTIDESTQILNGGVGEEGEASPTSETGREISKNLDEGGEEIKKKTSGDLIEEIEVAMAEAADSVAGMKGATGERRPSSAMSETSSIPGIIRGHAPSKVFEHQPEKICCLTLKVWATWLLEVAHNAHAWSKWLNDIIKEVRRIASIIRGEVKDSAGNPVVFYKEDWLEFSEKVDNMITSWRQYSMHVKDLTDKIVHNFRGKAVSCCPKCMHDNLIVDVAIAHNISQQLAEAMNTAGYWRRWLDSVVMETKRLTSATLTESESHESSYGTMEIIEIHEPHPTESDESLYEIEELDPYQ